MKGLKIVLGEVGYFFSKGTEAAYYCI